MILVVKTLRDFYEDGYWCGVRFSYIPDFGNADEQAAWSQGFRDGKGNNYSVDAYLEVL